MPTEIERKFLVISDAWEADADLGVSIRQGYLARTPRTVTRVRIAAGHGSVTVKSRRRGLVRDEFSYPVPLADAEYMLARLCVTPIVEKVRYRVPHCGMTWEVDVYPAVGLVAAEVELTHPDQPFALPEWIGREVTRDLRYRNWHIAAVAARRQQRGPTADQPRRRAGAAM